MEYCYNCFEGHNRVGPCPHCGYDLKQDEGKYPMALPYGSILAGHLITGRVLGQGGFGITYLCLDYKLQLRVAVKEFFPTSMAGRGSDSPQITAYTGQRGDQFRYGLEHFLDEARTLAKFTGNPNIVGVRSYFEENGTAYFEMEYVEGISLKAYLQKEGGKISWQQTAECLVPIMGALSSVHQAGIIHRDIAPDNIFLANNGTVKLLDFGAARYSLGDKSQSLDVVLKHGYAPMEQYTRRGKQGPYTDVYAMAATFYAAVTGYLPPDAIERLEQDTLRPPSAQGVNIPPALEQALLQGLQVRPEQRFQTMAEFQKAVQQAIFQPKAKLQPKKSSKTEPDTDVESKPKKKHWFNQNKIKPEQQQQKKQAEQPQEVPSTHASGKSKKRSKLYWIAAVLLFAVSLSCSFILAPSILNGPASGSPSRTSTSTTQTSSDHKNSGSAIVLSDDETSNITVYAVFEENAQAVVDFLEDNDYSCTYTLYKADDIASKLQLELSINSSPSIVIGMLDEDDTDIAFQKVASVKTFDPDNWLEDIFFVNTDQALQEIFLDNFEQETANIHVEGKKLTDGTYFGFVNQSKLPDGLGLMDFDDDDLYYGNWKNGKRSGYGLYIWTNGKTYEGDFVENQRTGYGVFTWPSGDRYEGYHVNGQRDGQGTYTWPNGNSYTGDFVENQRTGYGVFTWADGSRYEGEFQEGKRHGQGTLYYADGTKKSGSWKEDRFIG